jgi:hypothetical protein
MEWLVSCCLNAGEAELMNGASAVRRTWPVQHGSVRYWIKCASKHLEHVSGPALIMGPPAKLVTLCGAVPVQDCSGFHLEAC